jgi:hypothetical protein
MDILEQSVNLLMERSTRRTDDGHFRASVVDEQLLAGSIRLPHRGKT